MAETAYWITVERSGDLSPSAYYHLAVDENAGYADGALQVWGQSGYVRALPASDLAFRVIGEQELTEQMAAIVAGCGQFLTGCEVRETSGVAGPMYREGTATGRAELEKLLGYGTDDGGRLLATVRRERVLEVRTLPPAPCRSPRNIPATERGVSAGRGRAGLRCARRRGAGGSVSGGVLGGVGGGAGKCRR